MRAGVAHLNATGLILLLVHPHRSGGSELGSRSHRSSWRGVPVGNSQRSVKLSPWLRIPALKRSAVEGVGIATPKHVDGLD